MMFRSNKYRPAAFLFTLVMNVLLSAQGFSMRSQEAWKKDIEGIANSLQELKTEIRTINLEVARVERKVDTVNSEVDLVKSKVDLVVLELSLKFKTINDNMSFKLEAMTEAQEKVVDYKIEGLADKVDVVLLQRDVENVKKELKRKRDK